MTAYALKCRNEDFKVAEVPLDPFGAGADGDFTYVWLRKDGVTTFAAVEAVAAYFRLAPGDVEAAGLKDEDAITRQLVSVRQRLALSDLTAFNAAHAQITLDAGGACSYAGIGLTAVGATPIKATGAEAALRGQPLTDEAIRAAAQIAADESDPTADLRGPVEYKRAMVKELTKRALTRARERAG